MPDLISQYITSFSVEEEWRVLLTLAQALSPAQTCRTFNWRGELFSTPQTLEAFTRLASAQRPVALRLPAALDGLVPYSEEELRSARQRMACAVLFTRLLPDYQSNLRERLLTLMEARVPGDGNVGEWLAGMMEVTLSGMDTSLGTLRSVLS